MRTVGQAVSSAAVAAILVHHTSLLGGVPIPTLHGYLLAFAMAGTVAVVACAAALVIPADPTVRDTRRASSSSEEPRDEAFEGA
jgi:hypothetical protein